MSIREEQPGFFIRALLFLAAVVTSGILPEIFGRPFPAFFNETVIFTLLLFFFFKFSSEIWQSVIRSFLVLPLIIIYFLLSRNYYRPPVLDFSFLLFSLLAFLKKGPARETVYISSWLAVPYFFSALAGNVLSPAGYLILLPGLAVLPEIIPLKSWPSFRQKLLLFLALSVLFSLVNFPGIMDPAGISVLIDEAHASRESSLPENSFPESGHQLLVDFLSRNGCMVSRLTGEITFECLRKADVFISIMPSKPYDSKELEALSEFLENHGGGFLGIADHSALYGSGPILNHLTEKYGIAVSCDTVWIPSSRRGFLHYSNHPILRNLERACFSVGASLLFSGGAVSPIISTGCDGWADLMDERNRGRGKLGNGKFDRGEKSGYLPLAGEARAGRGKIILFGDSAFFQNQNLHMNYTLARRVVAYLGHRFEWLEFIKGIFIVLFVFFLCVRRTLPFELGFMLMAAMIVSASADRYLFHESEPVLGRPLTGVDSSHENAVSTYWKKHELADSNIDKFLCRLLRDGYWLKALEKPGKPEELVLLDSILLPSPETGLTRQESENYYRYVQNGGTLVITGNWRDEKALGKLLEHFGLSLADGPLSKDRPLMRDGFPARLFCGGFIAEGEGILRQAGFSSIPFYEPSETGGGTPLAKVYGKPVIVMKRIGDGQVYLIGDRYFVSNGLFEKNSGEISFRLMKYLLGRCLQ